MIDRRTCLKSLAAAALGPTLTIGDGNPIPIKSARINAVPKPCIGGTFTVTDGKTVYGPSPHYARPQDVQAALSWFRQNASLDKLWAG